MNTNSKTQTPQQDLKDALARYNKATGQNAEIYKTPGGYWHIVSPDFSFLFNAKTRQELTARLDAYFEGYLDGIAAKMRELGLFRSVDELLD